MKKGMYFLVLMTVIAVFAPKKPVAQNLFDDVKYWVGSGSDSALLVIDFLDNTWDSCYVWGVRFDGSTSGEDMLNNVAASDVNLTVNIGGGFLNDIYYGSHAGEGSNPDFWGTWSGTTIANLIANTGIGEVVNNGDIFGCSYTDFSPAISPGEPIPAFDSSAYTIEEPVFWVGTGNDSAILVIDFLDGTEMVSYAWGYAFDGIVTGEDMLNDISDADPLLDVDMGNFLNDIEYDGNSGIGGSPNFWGTWSATNLGNWDLNAGISIVVNDGDFFGCSYTDFSPALRPGYPQSATDVSSTSGIERNSFEVWPNPALSSISIDGVANLNVRVTDVQGRIMEEVTPSSYSLTINCSEWKKGTYLIQVSSPHETYLQKVVKH